MTWFVKKCETASAISWGVTSPLSGQSFVRRGLISTGGRAFCPLLDCVAIFNSKSVRIDLREREMERESNCKKMKVDEEDGLDFIFVCSFLVTLSRGSFY